jgi:UDP-N-acetylglucosamine acyltransferase
MITEPDWKGKKSNPNGQVIIGENTEIKEFVVINKPTENYTRIGNNCYIMSQVFVGHDCEIGNNVQLNPGCSIAGFVSIGDYSHVGMNASVHQHSKIGKFCVLGAGSFFKGSSPDGIVWGGVPAVPLKPNYVGIERSSLSTDDKKLLIKTAEQFVDIFKSSRNV